MNSKLSSYNESEELVLLRKTIADFAKSEVAPQAEQSDREEHFNLPLFRKLGPLGFLGLTAPEDFGGSAISAEGVVIVHEELSAVDPGFCLAYLAHTLLCVNNIVANGSDEQKKHYLPKLCSGDWVGAMAMSEPHAGTDVLALSTSAEKKGDTYKLNGRKMWITNGAISEMGADSSKASKQPCDCLFLYAVTGKKENGKPQISSFLIDGDAEGFSVGQIIKDKLGMRASYTTELCFDNCIVSKDALVGKEGEAIHHMMRNLEIERLGLAAMSLGIARRSLEIMISYADERKAFGSKLHSFGQIQQYIGDSYAEFRAAQSYVYSVAKNLDLNSSGNRLDSDGVKLFVAPVAKRIADRAIQVLGGYGYVGEYTVERLWRDAKLLEIGGGTLEAHQKNITRDLVTSI